MGAVIQPPTRLTAAHDVSNFTCRESALNEWLLKQALRNEGRLSRSYVTCVDHQVVGFYCLVNGAVRRDAAVSKLRRNAPDPVPVMIIGRLAVDQAWEGRGLGRGLLRDAILRTLGASEIAGIAALLVHAISPGARRFYEGSGFVASELERMTLMISLKDAAALLG
ncbi:GNAT family N-acetyltransferase [Acidisoma cladoniae]|uniref:GNAT family N-acetyltransferase n=1 Tax=Acidisoma cladoniae TaxID=3040935 RepID=UPI0025511545|nr:GNAT family N-acetyltransferase [Acidisoma sp. PAMC 29798]